MAAAYYVKILLPLHWTKLSQLLNSCHNNKFQLRLNISWSRPPKVLLLWRSSKDLLGLVVTVSSSYLKTGSEHVKQQSKFQRHDVKLSRRSFDKLLYIVFVKLDFHPAFWFSLTWPPLESKLDLLIMLTKAYQGMDWGCLCFLVNIWHCQRGPWKDEQMCAGNTWQWRH